jgi:hypothetical protein
MEGPGAWEKKHRAQGTGHRGRRDGGTERLRGEGTKGRRGERERGRKGDLGT